MKIRTEKDIQLLDEKLKVELGVDVGKYRNPEIAEKFVDLLVFPQFVISWMLRPILASLVLYFVGWYIFELSIVWSVIYGVFGLILYLINGLLFGIILVLWKLKTDMYSIVEFSLNIMKDSVSDLKHIGATTTKENRKETLSLLFLGITHIVTIPMVTTAICNKIPLIGGLLSWLVKRILRLIAGRIKFDYSPKIEGSSKEGSSLASVTNAYVKSIESTISGLDKLLTVILRVTQFPVVVITFFTLSLLGVLLLIVA